MGMQVGASTGKVRPEMNVTPLVDIVLVLLIIFMVLAPVMTKGFVVRLPPKDETDQKLDQATDSNKPLVLRIDEKGEPLVNEVPVSRDELVTRLERVFNAREDRVVYLDGHRDAAYGPVVGAIDLARAAGAKPVVVLTQSLE